MLLPQAVCEAELSGEHASSSVRMRVSTMDVAHAVEDAERAAGSVTFDERAPRDRLSAALAAASRGERTSVLVRSAELPGLRAPMRDAARASAALVLHVLAGHGLEEAAVLLDLGWGVLVSSEPEEAHALTLVAHGAAEVARAPIAVLHALTDARSAGLATATCDLLDVDRARAYFGALAHVRRDGEPAPDLARGLRVALDALGEASGRHRDLVDSHVREDSEVIFVGAGAIGAAVAAAVPALRSRGLRAGAITTSCLRPLPGARLVKRLARAHAIVVVEACTASDDGVLARELKASFCDALTWTPGYPGIGRVPAIRAMDGSGPLTVDLLEEHAKAALEGRSDVASDGRASVVPHTVTVTLWLGDASTPAIATRIAVDTLARGAFLRVLAIERREGERSTVDLHCARRTVRGPLLTRAPSVVVACGAVDVPRGRPPTLGIPSGAGPWSIAGVTAGAVAAAASVRLAADLGPDAVGRMVAESVQARGGDAEQAAASARDAFVRTRAALATAAVPAAEW